MQTLGKYELLKKIATGGMAEVWLARQTGPKGFQRLLVVKRVLPHLAHDPQFVRMLLNEAKIAARFNHPNIVQINDLGEVEGEPFIAMEYVRGEDLGRVIRRSWNRGQWVAQALAIRIAAVCCEGLSYAHSLVDEKGEPLGVVHRDISPQNILVSYDGSVKLVDFGIAKAAFVACHTNSGEIKGKFSYMSPEQACGAPLDRRSDIFSLGLVLYELLTGVRPLQRSHDMATLIAAKECEIEAPSSVAEEIPPELDAIVMRALAKRPEDRYQDAREFQMDLEELLVERRWVATSLQISELMATLFLDKEPVAPPQPLASSHSGSDPTAPNLAPPLRQHDADVTFILPVEAVRERTPVQPLPSKGPAPRFALKRRSRPAPRQLIRDTRWALRHSWPAEEERPGFSFASLAGTLGKGWGAALRGLTHLREWLMARAVNPSEARVP